MDGSVSSNMSDMMKLRKRHRMMVAGAAGTGLRASRTLDSSSSGNLYSQVSNYDRLEECSSAQHSRNSTILQDAGLERSNDLDPEDTKETGNGSASLIRPAEASEREASDPPSKEISKTRVSFSSLEPVRQRPNEKPWQRQLRLLGEIFFQWTNLLLLFMPLGLCAKELGFNEMVVFFANFFAIIPLASLLGAATEALSCHTGQLVGGLLNATFGNAVEMIMCVQAVKAGLLRVVQGNLLGSILSNLLLVLGMAICAAGYARKQQFFNAHGAAANMTCQLVASISVCLPTVFRTVRGSDDEEVLAISRLISGYLMLVYGLFLFFMLKTHADLFADEGEEEADEEVLLPSVSVALLFLCTLAVAGCSHQLVDSIEGVSENYGLPKAFIGVILLPIVGNAAEHSTAVTCAHKGLMDLALGVAVGSSTQIALFVVPCAVLCGWYFDQPMNLAFREFDTVCQLMSVFLVSQVLQHGNTNWLHGVMLMVVYVIIATQTWFIEED